MSFLFTRPNSCLFPWDTNGREDSLLLIFGSSTLKQAVSYGSLASVPFYVNAPSSPFKNGGFESCPILRDCVFVPIQDWVSDRCPILYECVFVPIQDWITDLALILCECVFVPIQYWVSDRAPILCECVFVPIQEWVPDRSQKLQVDNGVCFSSTKRYKAWGKWEEPRMAESKVCR